MSRKVYLNFLDKKHSIFQSAQFIFLKEKLKNKKTFYVRHIEVQNLNLEKSYILLNDNQIYYKMFCLDVYCHKCKKHFSIGWQYLLNLKNLNCNRHHCYNRNYLDWMNIIGKKYGTFIIEKFHSKYYREKRKDYIYFFKARCDCGRWKILSSENLRRKQFKPYCGYYTHYISKMEFVNLWYKMNQRCYDKHCKSYSSYGGRGIEVFSGWKYYNKNNKKQRENYYNFAKKMYELLNQKGLSSWDEAKKLNYSIDRIDNDKGYFPENIRLASRLEQNRNTRTVLIYFYKNVPFYVRDLMKIFKRKYHKVVHRKLGKYNGNIEKFLEKHSQYREEFDKFVNNYYLNKKKEKNQKDDIYKTIIHSDLSLWKYKDQWKRRLISK